MASLTITVSRPELRAAILRVAGSDEFVDPEYINKTADDDELKEWAINYLFGFECNGVTPVLVITD